MGRRQVCHSDCQPPFHGHSFLGFLSGQHFAKTTRDLADFTLICKRPFFVFFLTYDFIIATNFSISRDSLKGPIKWIKNKIETLSFRLWIRACVQLIHCFNVIFIVVMHERFYFQMGSARIVPLDDLHDRHLDDRHGFLTQLHVLHGHPHHHRSDFSVPLPNPLHFRWVPPSDAGDHSLMNTISLSLSLSGRKWWSWSVPSFGRSPAPASACSSAYRWPCWPACLICYPIGITWRWPLRYRSSLSSGVFFSLF